MRIELVAIFGDVFLSPPYANLKGGSPQKRPRLRLYGISFL